jgi:hypothetical protein
MEHVNVELNKQLPWVNDINDLLLWLEKSIVIRALRGLTKWKNKHTIL